MSSSSIFICCAFAVVAVASSNSAGLRLHGNSQQSEADSLADKENGHKSLLAQSTDVEQNLVICNGYTSDRALEIEHVRTKHSLTQSKPLAYKQCINVAVPLQEGDQLDFKDGSHALGSFYATGLPKTAASLLLIPHRRNPHAVGIKFESHAFTDSRIPQIAVIDAYRSAGDKQSSIKLVGKDPNTDDKEAEDLEEDLKFNSVVAVNPGKYEVSLIGSHEKHTDKVPLQASGATKYVVMRLGVEGDDKKKDGKYPMELVVFPNSGAQRFSGLTSVTLLAITTALLRLMA